MDGRIRYPCLPRPWLWHRHLPRAYDVEGPMKDRQQTSKTQSCSHAYKDTNSKHNKYIAENTVKLKIHIKKQVTSVYCKSIIDLHCLLNFIKPVLAVCEIFFKCYIWNIFISCLLVTASWCNIYRVQCFRCWWCLWSAAE